MTTFFDSLARACRQKTEQHWDWLLVTVLAFAASWYYFIGTPHVLGLDYFIHLSQAHLIKIGIAEGIPIPAFHQIHGAGTTFIRYQGMLVAQTMGWFCYILQCISSLSDSETLLLIGRIFGVLLTLGAGWGFHYASCKLLDVYGRDSQLPQKAVALVASTAYIFGWSRLGVVLHVGSLQRAGALVFFPVCFALFATVLARPLRRREQLLLGLSLAGCVLSHPGSFLYLCIVCTIFSVVSWLWRATSRSLQGFWRPWWTILWPATLSFLLAAWFLLPLLAEREYYGIRRRQQQKPLATSWTEILPREHLLEFIDRSIWFSDLNSDPQKGGSLIAGYGGVNSAYMGISVLALAVLALVLVKFHGKLGAFSLQIALTTALLFIAIIWTGFRHNVFHLVGHHFTLTFYWLEPLYCMLCFTVLFGAGALWFMARRVASTTWALRLLILLTLLIAGDFSSLLLQQPARDIYYPQQGMDGPLGITQNHWAFDSHDIIARHPRRGRVLDLPILLLHCNHLRHRRADALSAEPNTDWPEARSFSEMVMHRETSQAIDFSLEYANRASCYSFQPDNFQLDRRAFTRLADMQWQSRDDWQGQTTVAIKFSLPLGKYRCWATFPLYLPAYSRVEATSDSASPVQISARQKPFHYFLLIPLENQQLQQKQVEITLTIHIDKATEPLVIGASHPPFIAYDGPSLAYRLALLDVRFIVVNRKYFASTTSNLSSSQTIRKIYQSPRSALYENLHSTPWLFPEHVFLIQSPQPWKLFNEDLSHHPNYDPHKVGFCYSGSEQDFSGTISRQSWQQKILPLWLQKSTQSGNRAKIIATTLESTTYDIEMQKAGYFFPSLHFHPNLRASIEASYIPTYLAQAGMLAVKLPAGKHRLRIFYHHPWYDHLGKWLSALTFVALLLYAGVLLISALIASLTK